MTELKYSELILGIANNIKRTRKAKKLTVQEIAYRCEMERSNMSRIEAGHSNITIRTLWLIASALNVNIVELIPHDMD